MSQHNHLIVLRDKVLRCKSDSLLRFGHFAKELANVLAPLPRAGKGHVGHGGHLPLNIVGEQRQERWYVTCADPLICLLHQACVCLLVHRFPIWLLQSERGGWSTDQDSSAPHG